MSKSVYKYASEAGLPVGLYLTAMSACLLMSVRFPWLPTFIFPLALGFPVLLWYLMKRISDKEPAYLKVSALWLGGMYAVIFGTLICTLLSGLYLTFVEPGFMTSYVSNAISTLESSPMSSEYAPTIDLMREAIEARVLPSSMEFISGMGWFTCFAGSLLSLILAVVITSVGRRRKKRLSLIHI